jgi:hypothetical protein
VDIKKAPFPERVKASNARQPSSSRTVIFGKFFLSVQASVLSANDQAKPSRCRNSVTFSLRPLKPLPPTGDALAVLRRLGPVPFWRGIHPCQETLEKILSRQQVVARAAANGESVDLRA